LQSFAAKAAKNFTISRRKNMRQNSLFVFAFLFFAACSVNVLAQGVRTSDARRTIYRECVPIGQVIDTRSFKAYVNKSSLDGMRETTAGEVGWTWVWNEVGDQMCKTELAPGASVYVVNEAHPMGGYLDKCMRNGIPYKNRIVPIEEKVAVPTPTPVATPIPTPTPLPDCDQGTVRSTVNPRLCILTVKEQLPPVPVYVNPCPVDDDAVGTISMSSRVFGELDKAVISGGVSAAGSAMEGARGWGIVKAALGGVAIQRVERVFNASEDGLNLVIPSLGVKEHIQKGEIPNLGQGLSVGWTGRKMRLYRSYGDKKFRCSTYGLSKASNMAVWIKEVDLEEELGVIVKDKTQPLPQNRPGTEGSGSTRIPGNDVPDPTNTIPTRPRSPNAQINGFADDNSQNLLPSPEQVNSNPLMKNIAPSKDGRPSWCNEPGVKCANVLQSDGSYVWQQIN
jgi:hypothetical protein